MNHKPKYLKCMSDDNNKESRANSKKRKEALGGKKEKGFTGDGEAGSEGGYGFISPAAESGDSADSGSDSE